MRSFRTIRILPVRTLTSTLPRRVFSTSLQSRLREDASRSPSEVEKAKQESIKKQEWSRDTASQSEEVVGADQENVKDHEKHMEELQKETAKESEKEKGKS